MTTAERTRRRSRLPIFARLAVVLAGLFVVADIVIGLMIWLPYRREQQIIAEIKGWGGKTRSESCESNWLGTDADWVRLVIDAERMKVFDRVTEVWCSDSQITDAGVSRLTGLKHLKSLGLSRTPVSDSSLAHLGTMSNLESLFLDKTQISDASLANLGRLTTLRKLSLANTLVTEDGLAHLRGLRNLEVLWLKHTVASDATCTTLQAVLPDCRIER